jgi:thymidine phosphorylase
VRIVDLILAKRDGRELAAEEINEFIAACTAGEIPDYQVAPSSWPYISAA